MKKRKLLSIFFILAAVFLFAGCDDDNQNESGDEPAASNQDNMNVEDNGAGGGLGAANANNANIDAGTENNTQPGSIDEWLQQVNNDQLPTVSETEGLDYGLGYFVYYTEVETALDTLIYNALVVHDQIANGDVTEGNLNQQQQNLVDFTGDLEYNSEIPATEQIAQSQEIRDAIISRVVDDQSSLSPQEALDSNEVIGFVAGHAASDIGRKYLVYTQDSPDSDFEFLGVVLVVDADGQALDSSETYNFQGWEDLPLLGDASGPFWNNLPVGVSGDPSNTDEGRPGVLLVSQSTFQEIQ